MITNESSKTYISQQQKQSLLAALFSGNTFSFLSHLTQQTENFDPLSSQPKNIIVVDVASAKLTLQNRQKRWEQEEKG